MIGLLVAGTVISGITAIFNWIGKAQNEYNESQKRKVAEENGFKSWDEMVLFINHEFEMEKQKAQQEWQSGENELDRQATADQNALDRELKTQLQTQGEQHDTAENALNRLNEQNLQNQKLQHESAEAVLNRQHETELQQQKLAQEYYLQTNAKAIEYQDLKNAGLNPALMYGTSAISGNTQAPPIRNSAQAQKPQSVKQILNSAYKEAITQKAIQEIKKLILKNNTRKAKKVISKTIKQA